MAGYLLLTQCRHARFGIFKSDPKSFMWNLFIVNVLFFGFAMFEKEIEVK